jgi:hypothetical protein
MKKNLLTVFMVCFMLTSAVGCSEEAESNKTDESSETTVTTEVATESTNEAATETTTEAGENEEISIEDFLSDDSFDLEDLVLENTADRTVIEEMSGKTLAELVENGYDINGYFSFGDSITVNVSNKDFTDDAITSMIDSLNGKTVKELVEEYDVSIGYMGFNDDYLFTSYIGSVGIQFDIENGAKAIKAHEEETFFDLEEAEEIQSDILENIKITDLSFDVKLDDASNQMLSEAEDCDTDYIKENANVLVVDELSYTIK